MSDKSAEEKLLAAERSEITEHFIYQKLADGTKDAKNKEILEKISGEELKHYNIWKGYTKKESNPDRFKIWRYYFISRIFGITFGMKLMEGGEERAQKNYGEISKLIPEADEIEKDEEGHERQLINLINEDRLQYIGSVVLGLHDALIELTGVLAGFTLALQNARLVIMTALITGVAASLSMGASEYLSTRAEESSKDPSKAAAYTGVAYFLAVIFLLIPYFIFKNIYFCLGLTMLGAFILVALFTFYISVVKNISFSKRFFEMASITFGVAVLTFGIGFLVRMFLGVTI